MDMDYFSSVAKRTRARTDKYWQSIFNQKQGKPVEENSEEESKLIRKRKKGKGICESKKAESCDPDVVFLGINENNNGDDAVDRDEVIEIEECDDDDDSESENVFFDWEPSGSKKRKKSMEGFGKGNEVHHIGFDDDDDASCEEKEEIFREPKLKKEVQSRESVLDNEDVEDQMNFEDFVEREAEKNGEKGVDCSVAETESSGVKKVSSEEVGLSSSETGDIETIVISDDSDQVSSSSDGYGDDDEEDDEDGDDDSDDDDYEVGRAESSESMDESSSSYAEDDDEEEDAFEEDEVGCREKKKNTIKPPLKKRRFASEKKEKKLGNPSMEFEKKENAFEEDEVGCREKKKNTIKPPLKKRRFASEKKEKKLGNPSMEFEKKGNAFEEDEVGRREKKKNTIKPPLKKRRFAAEKKEKKLGNPSMEFEKKEKKIGNQSMEFEKKEKKLRKRSMAFEKREKKLRNPSKECEKMEKKLGNPSKEFDNIDVFGDSSSDSEIEIMAPEITRSNGVDNLRDVETKNCQKKLNVTSRDEDDDDDDDDVVNADENGGKGETSCKLDRECVDDENFGVEKVVLEKGKMGEFGDVKQKKVLKSSDMYSLLLNSILEKGEAIQDDLVAAQEPETNPTAAENTLPLKFRFGVEEPEPKQKSEFEEEIDNLWEEFEFAKNSLEIGSSPLLVADNEDTGAFETEENDATHCSQGKHDFEFDEEIGIRCRCCSFVQLEIKYTMPEFMKYSSGISNKRSHSGEGGCSILDELQFQHSGGKSGESSSHAEDTVWDLIPGIRKTMYQHQQEGFEFIWKNLTGSLVRAELESSDPQDVGGCIISHAPGTGKTRLTIVFLQTYLEMFPNSRPVIIAPASMLLTWEEEFRKWNIGIPFHNLNNMELSANENIVAANIYDANGHQIRNKRLIRIIKLILWSKGKSILGVSYCMYERLAGEKYELDKETKKKRKIEFDKESEQMRKILLEVPGLLVLDEGHTPRNQKSRIWKVISKIETKRRIILSGTPFQNNFDELNNILCLVRPKFTDMSSRLQKLSTNKQMKKKSVVGEKSTVPFMNNSIDRHTDDIEELKAKIAPFVHVHRGSILQESLPGLKECVVVLNPTHVQKSMSGIIQCSKISFELEHKLSLSSVHPSLMLKASLTEKEESMIDKVMLEGLRLVPNEGIKTRFLMELVRLSVALNEKVLVFSQYIETLSLIKDQLNSIFDWSEGKEVLQMHGKLDQKHRQFVINVFNDPKSEARILLASTRACSEGINLVGASRVVLLDVVWNPSVERQAISRAYRIGQKKVVYTYHLIMLGTSEWDKYCKQTEKDRLSELVFSSSNKEEIEKKRVSIELLEDKILDEMISHEKLQDMFDRIIYQPKESKLIETST